MENNNEEKIFYRTTPKCFELFEYIKYIEHCVSTLKGLVQNDMVVDNLQINEWKKSIQSISKNLISLEHKSSLIFERIDNLYLTQKIIEKEAIDRLNKRYINSLEGK